MDIELSNTGKLKDIKRRIHHYNLRFPTSELAQTTGFQKSNISSMLNGKKPVSDTFWRKVIDNYPMDEDKILPYANPVGSDRHQDKWANVPPDDWDPDQVVEYYPEPAMVEIVNMVQRHIMVINNLEKQHNENLAAIRKEYYDKMVKYKQLIFKILHFEGLVYQNIATLKDGKDPGKELESFEKRKQEILIDMMRIEDPAFVKAPIGFEPSEIKNSKKK